MASLVLSERLRVIEITDARTGQAHRVTEHAAVAGRRAGRYRAVCDELVLPASLTVPERGRCRPCASRRLAR